MTITLSRCADAPRAGTGTARRYVVPTAVTHTDVVPAEPADTKPWFAVPADQTDPENSGSSICALCSGTGRLPGGNRCPGADQAGPPVAWVAIEEVDEHGHWVVVFEGIRDLNSTATDQAAVDRLLDQLADEERPGRRYTVLRFSAVAPGDDGRSVFGYREVAPGGTVAGTHTPPLFAEVSEDAQ